MSPLQCAQKNLQIYRTNVERNTTCNHAIYNNICFDIDCPTVVLNDNYYTCVYDMYLHLILINIINNFTTIVTEAIEFYFEIPFNYIYIHV